VNHGHLTVKLANGTWNLKKNPCLKASCENVVEVLQRSDRTLGIVAIHHRECAVYCKGIRSRPSPLPAVSRSPATPDQVTRCHGLCPHLYTDDIQMYGFVNRLSHWWSRTESLSVPMLLRLGCSQTRSSWIQLLTSTSRRLHKLQQHPLRVGTDKVTSVAVVRGLVSEWVRGLVSGALK